MKIVISSQAEKALKKFSKVDQIALTRKIRQLKEKPEVTKEEKLKSLQNIFRIRVGDFRIVYKRTSQQIYIILIGHRKDIYDLLRRLL